MDYIYTFEKIFKDCKNFDFNIILQNFKEESITKLKESGFYVIGRIT